MRRRIGWLSLKRVKVALVLLASALFVVSFLRICETASDPPPVVVHDHSTRQSKSPFVPGPSDSAAGLALGATRLVWANDGEHLLFSSGWLLGIYVVDSAGLELRAFPETAPQFGDWERPGAFAPSLSPDGSRVAYSVFVPLDSTVIETAAIDGSDVQRLMPFDPNSGSRYKNSVYPVWSPDGQQIAFVSNRAVPRGLYYGYRLFVMGADGSDVRGVAQSIEIQGTEDLQSVKWSPDGSRIAFVGTDTDFKGSLKALYTVQPDGSALTRIGDVNVYGTRHAAWSPDGSRLAFIGQVNSADGNSSYSLFTAKVDGSSLTMLGSTGWPDALEPLLAWSPDGAWLAFQGVYWTSSDSIGPAVYIARPDGTELRQVGSRYLGPVSWTPDSKEVLFGGLGTLVRVDGSGSHEWFQDRHSKPLQVAWSPDGSRLAVLSVPGESAFNFVLYTVARDGTDKRVLARGTVSRVFAEHSAWRDVAADISACAELYKDTSGLVKDCQTLLRIRDSLAGGILLNWNADTSIQAWQGISVSGNPRRVRKLNLNQSLGPLLTGKLSPELGNLSELDYLDLSNNSLTGSIPAELGNLRKLEYLDLSRNRLNGNIPVELGELNRLRFLLLSNNFLSGSIPAELGNLSRLEYLDLYRNSLTDNIPAEMGRLKKLRHLFLQQNKLGGSIPHELGNLARLEKLWFHRNKISGCIPKRLSGRREIITDGLAFCE